MMFSFLVMSQNTCFGLDYVKFDYDLVIIFFQKSHRLYWFTKSAEPLVYNDFERVKTIINGLAKLESA